MTQKTPIETHQSGFYRRGDGRIRTAVGGFADLYLANGLHAQAAAKALDYKNEREGYRLLDREDIKAYVKARLDELGFTTDQIRSRLEYFARGDMRDFLSIAPTERSYWVRAEDSKLVQEAAKKRGVEAEAMDEYDLAGIVGTDRVAQTQDGVLMVCEREIASEVQFNWRGAEQAQALGRIKKLKVGNDGSVDFELHDPTRSLELLGKAQKMFTDRTELTGADGQPLQVNITRRVIGGES